MAASERLWKRRRRRARGARRTKTRKCLSQNVTGDAMGLYQQTSEHHQKEGFQKSSWKRIAPQARHKLATSRRATGVECALHRNLAGNVAALFFLMATFPPSTSHGARKGSRGPALDSTTAPASPQQRRRDQRRAAISAELSAWSMPQTCASRESRESHDRTRQHVRRHNDTSAHNQNNALMYTVWCMHKASCGTTYTICVRVCVCVCRLKSRYVYAHAQ